MPYRVELWHTFHLPCFRSLQATLSCKLCSLHSLETLSLRSHSLQSTACNNLARLRVATGCGLIDLFAYRQYGKPLCLQHRSHPLFVPHSSHAPTSSSTRRRLACTTSAIHYAALHSLHPFFLTLAQGCFTGLHTIHRKKRKSHKLTHPSALRLDALFY